MDNPRAGVYLSPWDIKVSGLPQADHKHNRTFRFTLKRVLMCIHRATKWRFGRCLDGSTADGLEYPIQGIHRFSCILFLVTFYLALTFSVTVTENNQRSYSHHCKKSYEDSPLEAEVNKGVLGPSCKRCYPQWNGLRDLSPCHEHWDCTGMKNVWLDSPPLRPPLLSKFIPLQAKEAHS